LFCIFVWNVSYLIDVHRTKLYLLIDCQIRYLTWILKHLSENYIQIMLQYIHRLFCSSGPKFNLISNIYILEYFCKLQLSCQCIESDQVRSLLFYYLLDLIWIRSDYIRVKKSWSIFDPTWPDPYKIIKFLLFFILN
jgi:hypothetical protein